MKIHREGHLIIGIAITILLGFASLNLYVWKMLSWDWLFILINLGLLFLAILIIRFFRIPKIKLDAKPNQIVCPADGKIVVIEEVEESEFFKDKRIQISIFMSIWDVHANFNPISGTVKYVKYHPGKFLVAWHPKSSTDNERTTFVVEHANGQSILHRQIAGAVARRICYYIEEKDKINVGEEYGFIKFGSRIDVFLPLGTKINVKVGDKVKGRKTILGEF